MRPSISIRDLSRSCPKKFAPSYDGDEAVSSPRLTSVLREGRRCPSGRFPCPRSSLRLRSLRPCSAQRFVLAKGQGTMSQVTWKNAAQGR